MKVIRYKKWVLPRLFMLMVSLIAFQAVAEDFSQLQKPRAFTLLDDKSVTLKILDWNPQRKKFHVENNNGKRVWVSPGTFIEADQSYLKEWISAHWFLSNNKLYVSAKREARGGYVSYNVSIYNKTSVDYAKVSMNYEVERIWDNYETGGEENKNVPGKIFIGLIKAGSHRDFQTQPVRASETYKMIHSTEPVRVTSGVGYTYTNEVPRKTGKEKVNGIRLKLLGPKLDNVRIIRDVHIDK
ncbi:hypothetical protein P4B35_06875 [Pontiellaceae bacterium B12227]|nr:hypothetical protein [Pontiellaceae bacterium B12227]